MKDMKILGKMKKYMTIYPILLVVLACILSYIITDGDLVVTFFCGIIVSIITIIVTLIYMSSINKIYREEKQKKQEYFSLFLILLLLFLKKYAIINIADFMK